MFSFCTDQEDVKSYTTKIFGKRNDKHVTKIVEIDDVLNSEVERDI